MSRARLSAAIARSIIVFHLYMCFDVREKSPWLRVCICIFACKQSSWVSRARVSALIARPISWASV